MPKSAQSGEYLEDNDVLSYEEAVAVMGAGVVEGFAMSDQPTILAKLDAIHRDLGVLRGDLMARMDRFQAALDTQYEGMTVYTSRGQ
ncbi:MAG: hypothetical protein M3Y41_13645 [Pseudomonadota bacterium]|nr:hypothetical protein [Pseudomonadota bacterium]